jgi:hypothetical protein
MAGRVKNYYYLDEVLAVRNHWRLDFGVVIKSSDNKYYLVTDRQYLTQLKLALGFNEDTLLETALERVGAASHRTIEVMGEDISDSFHSRMYAKMFGLEYIAGNMCLQMYMKMLRHFKVTDKRTGEELSKSKWVL